MEKSYKIGPGTAGLAQRIPTAYDSKSENLEEESSKLHKLSFNEIMPCGHNQY